ncbi:protein CutA isoform X2 [Pituophis catenifer annectens]|uniref:protein CutA isoform X2 n=1 Tax=Pituophis catenifer annectens TaxID=94852 RepID=UPI003990E3B0
MPLPAGACGVAALLLALLMVPALQRLSGRLFSSSSSSMAAEPPSSPAATALLSAAFVTCPNETVAKDIASYRWKDAVEEEAEVLLMIKTRSSRVSALAEYVRSVHPYEVAEVISVPIQQGNPPYLRWVEEAVAPE